jgi:hypothetical protein
MPDDSSHHPAKFFPRNLTARADYLVRGNPMNTRPESGVDNCYPGLEFDQRNLDKAFFPGLVFEFHRDDGAILHRIVSGSLAGQMGLSDADLPLYLWAMMGRTAHDQSEQDPPAFFFFGLNGLEVWRRVHDLLPGRIAILIGPAPGFSALPATAAVIRDMDRLRDSGESIIQRDEGGRIQVAIFVSERARYVDESGVIDLDAYEPGELTRSLCAPWQYDFRDCGCFYWAASKPDLVTSADGQYSYLNFQRKDRTSSPPPQDIPPAAPSDRENWLRLRRNEEIDYADLIAGAWNDLPVVLNDRESERFVPPHAPTVPRLMTRQEVIDELRYLATVEHALCVEYLYAHYSLNAPPGLPQTGLEDPTRRIFSAAQGIFTIAVDEMRHLRWVNEALDLLGQTPSLGRADRIGRALDRPFELKPLTPEQLQWFIDVEKPSQAIDEGVDGMYVRLHTSIDRQPDVFPERDRMVHLIKLIIDEGGDHYERFLSIQKHLAGLDPNEYLRSIQDPPPASELVGLQDLADQNYAVLLGSLRVTFSLGDRAGGILLEQSRRAMFNLHETNHYIAAKGVRSRFTLPPAPTLPFDAEAAHEHVDLLESSLRAALSAVTDIGEVERALAERQRRINEELFERMHQLITEDLGR